MNTESYGSHVDRQTTNRELNYLALDSLVLLLFKDNRMRKQIIISISSLILTTFSYANVGIDYLNTLRTKTGLPVFTEHINLTSSSQNHSDYMQINNVLGHYEKSNKTGYTGDYGEDRSIFSGYFSRTISENVSYGATTVQGSIDNLFSAIYHRFGFLTLSFDEVGIGISSNNLFHTYNMGNSTLNDLCKKDTYSEGSYYSNVCVDTAKKIESTDYENASNNIKDASPELILWPSANSDDILPVFYEESPDPLPSHSISGYPISVEFNNGRFSTAPVLSDFMLEDTSGRVLNTLTLMNETNDPNSKFSAYQYALFPEKRLEWGSQYTAEIIYEYNSVQSTKSWCFTTRSLRNIADRFYRIEDNEDITLNVLNGYTYAIYIVPNNTHDRLGGVSTSYTSDSPVFSYIDSNTVSVTMTGNSNEYSSFTFSNGQKIKLILASSDTATVPANASCSTIVESDFDNDGIPDSIDTDDDNDGISDILELINKLNPLDASDAQEDADDDGMSNSIEISLGSDIYDPNSTPEWVLIPMGDGLMIPIPYLR